MSTILLRTPDSSIRTNSINSTPPSSPNRTAMKPTGTPDSKHADYVSKSQISTTNTDPTSPRASDRAVVVPRRIFVGGFPQTTTEHELRCYFEKFGHVEEVKIIREHSTRVKGKYSYGFVTFETEEEANKLIAIGKTPGSHIFEFRGRFLNINEAVRKPPFNKQLQLTMNSTPPTGLVLRDIYGQIFTVQNGYATLASPEAFAVTHPQPMTPTYPFVMQQHPVFFASMPSPAPVKHGYNLTNNSFGQLPATPMSAPFSAQQHPQSTVPPHLQKSHFSFPPVSGYPPSFNGNQMHHLPPTPLASPGNPEPPMETAVPNFTSDVSNPAITNLTNPFPSVIGSNSPQMAPNQYHRWTTTTMAGPVTQLLYPGTGGYPTFIHDGGQSYSQMPGMQQSCGNGVVPGAYPLETHDDYAAFAPFNSVPEAQMMGYQDKGQSKKSYGLDGMDKLKDLYMAD